MIPKLYFNLKKVVPADYSRKQIPPPQFQPEEFTKTAPSTQLYFSGHQTDIHLQAVIVRLSKFCQHHLCHRTNHLVSSYAS